MKDVTIFQDGKASRHVAGTILRRRGKRIQIEFIISDWKDDKYLPVTMIRWFKKRRRDEGGVYECHGMNYWYYVNMGKYYEEIVAHSKALDN